MKDNIFSEAYHLEKTIFLNFGFYPVENSQTKIWTRLKKTFVLTLMTAYVISIFSTFSFEKFSNDTNSVLWITEASFFVKLFVFMYHEKTLLKFEDLLGDIASAYVENEHKHLVLTHTGASRKFVTVYIIFLFTFLSFVTLYVPLFGYTERVVPAGSYVPCNLENDICYVSFYAFNLIGTFLTAIVNVSLDCTFCELTAICCAVFNIVEHNLGNVDYMLENKAQDELRSNIVLHGKALRLVTYVDQIYNKISFAQCIGSVFILCCTLIRLNTIPIQSVEFIGVFNFLVIEVIQIAVFCWFGNNVIMSSTAISYACYKSNWYESKVRLRKTLQLIMQRSQKPFIITAGGFFTLSLATLMSIFKSSYSFWNVYSHAYN